MINFNIPCMIGAEAHNIRKVILSKNFSGDGNFTKKCHKWLEKKLGCKKALLTTSCTHALEMAAILVNIKKGDEIIMPSYAFASTANAFVLRGARIVFVDIRPDTMNIDEKLIGQAITSKTKAIVVVHYAGVSCEMDTIIAIAKKYNLFIIEDAAQGVMSRYKGKYLGTIADIGCYSFHETKNLHCGEGGAIVLNKEQFFDRAEIIREKGTNKTQFLRGLVDKYTWVDIGSSYLPSELNAAFLYSQFQHANSILKYRLKIWNLYYDSGLSELAAKGFIELPNVPKHCDHNAHIFYIKVKNLRERINLIEFLKRNNIVTAFHYLPLHSSLAGKIFARFHGDDKWTTRESERLLRLPLFYGLKDYHAQRVAKTITDFFCR